MSDATAIAEVTFEDGYDDLKDIVARLDAEDVSVHEMCELFARGKGLEKALRTYLEAQKGKLDEIEAGENLPEFAIVAPSEPDAEPDGASRVGFVPRVEEDDRDFQPTAVTRRSPPADDDIPF